MKRMKTDVLVIGAGPCGLMLANELGQRKVEAVVGDMEPGVSKAPQANATQARSMEHYRRHGLSGQIRKLGLPGDHPTDVAYFTTYSGHELARHKMPSSNDADRVVRELHHIWNGPELPHRVPQSAVENVLWRKAEEHASVSVEFNWKLVDFAENENAVSANLVHTKTGEQRQIVAQFMFAADGAQSVVRKQLGIRYSGGGPTKRDFMGGQMLSIYIDAPEFYKQTGVEKAWMYWTFNPRRRALLASVDGKGKFVLQTQLRGTEKTEDFTEKEAGDLFTAAVGKTIDFKVTGVASWLAGRALVADRFSTKRVFLGGDAVHLFTPTGGMGYNTAIEDAVNIGWKLAAVVRGQSPRHLLDSYELERKPVAHRNTEFAIRFADSIGLYVPSPAIEDDGPAGTASRKRAGAYLHRHAANEFNIPGFSLGARYDGSPIIADDGSPTPPDAPSVYVPSAKPGGRAPHVWLSDGGSLYDKFGFDWTLLCLTSQCPHAGTFEQAAKKNGINLTVLDLSGEPEAMDFYETPLVLIRPDQIVAWRGEVNSANDIADVLKTTGFIIAT